MGLVAAVGALRKDLAVRLRGPRIMARILCTLRYRGVVSPTQRVLQIPLQLCSSISLCQSQFSRWRIAPQESGHPTATSLPPIRRAVVAAARSVGPLRQLSGTLFPPAGSAEAEAQAAAAAEAEAESGDHQLHPVPGGAADATAPDTGEDICIAHVIRIGDTLMAAPGCI